MSRMRVSALVLLSCLTATLVGCGEPAPPAPPKDEHKALQRAIQEPLDKARAVEDRLQEQQKAIQRQLDDAEN